jgi:hypothetical protein
VKRLILTILIVIALVSSAYAGAYQRTDAAYKYGTGGFVMASIKAKVWVYQAGTQTLATIYSNSGGTTTTTNPVTADSYGNYSYYADAGFYDEVIVGPAGTAPVCKTGIVIGSRAAIDSNIGSYYISGAVDDNSTDSYAAIQSSIEAIATDSTNTVLFAGAARGDNAKVIVLPHGRYKISDTISIPTGVILDLSNSIITQTTPGKDIIRLRWVTGYGYYGTFRGGIKNGHLDGGGVARYGLLLEKTSWADISNLSITRCQTGIMAEEAQYNLISQINSHGNSVDGIVFTYSPDQLLLTSIDNTLVNVNASYNSRYGIVFHAARNNYIYKIDASRNLAADIVVGGTYWGSPAGYSVGNIKFYGVKSEHNRDDVPSSGYSIIIDGSYGVSIDNLTVSRQTSGSLYNPYFKWLYNNSYGTVLNNPYDFVLAAGGAGLLENPLVPGDYSIFRCITYNGLLVNYGAHWQTGYIHNACTDATDVSAGGSSRYTYTYGFQGGMASAKYSSISGGSGDIALGARVNGDSNDRLYVSGGGVINLGSGSAATDATIYRSGVGAVRTSGDFTIDGIGYSTGGFKSTLFTPPIKNEPMTVQTGLWELPGIVMYMLNTAITNTSGNTYGIYINPTYNQAAGTGTNTALFLAPTYSTTSSGAQYVMQAQPIGAPEAVFSIEKGGFVSHGTGSTLVSAATITPTGPVSIVTGVIPIYSIAVPHAGFNGSITLIPQHAMTTVVSTTGNIALATTATGSRPLIMNYLQSTNKWYPSY